MHLRYHHGLILALALLLTACSTTSNVKPGAAAQPVLTFPQAKAAFVNKDYTAALNAFSELAEKGDANAQYAVGYMYYGGLGTTQNSDKALLWIRKAADQGQDKALKALALMQNARASFNQQTTRSVPVQTHESAAPAGKTESH